MMLRRIAPLMGLVGKPTHGGHSFEVTRCSVEWASLITDNIAAQRPSEILGPQQCVELVLIATYHSRLFLEAPGREISSFSFLY